jgi:cytosine/adenosine deaminase-related metal-dependent hydrolase
MNGAGVLSVHAMKIDMFEEWQAAQYTDWRSNWEEIETLMNKDVDIHISNTSTGENHLIILLQNGMSFVLIPISSANDEIKRIRETGCRLTVLESNYALLAAQVKQYEYFGIKSTICSIL